LSPTRRAGNSSRKLPARTSSTSWHSAGEALCTDTARGRLLVAAIATIFVPLPRRVGPTAKPPFWRSRKWHPRMPRLGSTDRARGGAAPGAAAPVPASHSVPIAGTGGDRSGKADIFRAVHATVPRCPTPRAHHAGRRVCRAMDDHAYRRGVAAAAPAPPLPTVHRSDPNGHASAQSEISRASPECLQSGFDLFMRLVLGVCHPERSEPIRIADRSAQSKACPERSRRGSLATMVLGRARLQPCRQGTIRTRALAPEGIAGGRNARDILLTTSCVPFWRKFPRSLRSKLPEEASL